MLGFRFTFNQPHQQSWWSDGTVYWFWAACEREQLPVGLCAVARPQRFRRMQFGLLGSAAAWRGGNLANKSDHRNRS
jgi:hypothetical protein